MRIRASSQAEVLGDILYAYKNRSNGLSQPAPELAPSPPLGCGVFFTGKVLLPRTHSHKNLT